MNKWRLLIGVVSMAQLLVTFVLFASTAAGQSPLTAGRENKNSQAEEPVATSSPALRDKNSAEKPGTEGNGNVVVRPDYKIDPDLADRANPKGKYFEFSMRLADSKIFRGDDPTLDPKKPVRQQRKIFVYVPAAWALDALRQSNPGIVIDSDPKSFDQLRGQKRSKSPWEL